MIEPLIDIEISILHNEAMRHKFWFKYSLMGIIPLAILSIAGFYLEWDSIWLLLFPLLLVGFIGLVLGSIIRYSSIMKDLATNSKVIDQFTLIKKDVRGLTKPPTGGINASKELRDFILSDDTVMANIAYKKARDNGDQNHIISDDYEEGLKHTYRFYVKGQNGKMMFKVPIESYPLGVINQPIKIAYAKHSKIVFWSKRL